MSKDKTYCTGDNCPFKQNCARFKGIGVGFKYFFNIPPIVVKNGKQKCDWYEKLEQDGK